MTEKEATRLLKKWKEGKCSVDELAILETWFDDLDVYPPKSLTDEEYDLVQARIWDRLNTQQPDRSTNRKSIMMYRRVAAAVILILVSGTLYFILHPVQQPDLYSYNKAHDVPAGTNKAILTLANGQQIILDAAKAGAIANQNGVTVTKNKNGQIIYTGSPGSDEETTFNTITTPNGGQYEVYLPDGSHVYLNAASSLKYPVKFAAKERRVTLTGEGYFEITENPARPFFVVAANQVVKVLGTHFNINAYEAGTDPVKTTLAKGAISITLNSIQGTESSSPHHTLPLPSKILKPGEQAINNGRELQLKAIEVDNETAWKDGLFIFDQTTTKSVFQQIARWYNVTVDYSSLPEGRFDGAMARNQPLSELLKAIEVTNQIKLKIEGRKITVQK